MKRLCVGILILLVALLAWHYGVITVKPEMLLKYIWPIVQWVTQVLGAWIITSQLNKTQKSGPIT
jgi:uncharacterized membrane protein (Fun14 family)